MQLKARTAGLEVFCDSHKGPHGHVDWQITPNRRFYFLLRTAAASLESWFTAADRQKFVQSPAQASSDDLYAMWHEVESAPQWQEAIHAARRTAQIWALLEGRHCPIAGRERSELNPQAR